LLGFLLKTDLLFGTGRTRADLRVPGRTRAETFFGRCRFVKAGWCRVSLDRTILLRKMKAVGASLEPTSLFRRKFFWKRRFLGAGILLRKVTFFQRGNFSAKWTVSGSTRVLVNFDRRATLRSGEAGGSWLVSGNCPGFELSSER
jgi:hypothetical protein